MQSKHRIAIWVALVFAVPAGVAALEQAAPGAIAEPVELRAASQPASQPDSQPDAGGGGPVIGTALDGGLVRATPSDVFPSGSEVEWELLPALALYLDTQERNLGPALAWNEVIPQGSDVEWEPLPAQVAYFDRIEHQRMAGAQPDVQAAAPVSPAAADGEPRNPLQKAADYISGLFKSWSDSASAPADNTAAADQVR